MGTMLYTGHRTFNNFYTKRFCYRSTLGANWSKQSVRSIAIVLLAVASALSSILDAEAVQLVPQGWSAGISDGTHITGTGSTPAAAANAAVATYNATYNRNNVVCDIVATPPPSIPKSSMLVFSIYQSGFGPDHVCEANYLSWGSGFGGANSINAQGVTDCSTMGSCPIAVNKSRGAQCKTGQTSVVVGNPISVGIGNKFDTTLDYQGVLDGLIFSRTYNSNIPDQNSSIGRAWRSNFDYGMVGSGGTQITSTTTAIGLYRPDGNALWFLKNGSQWKSDSDVLEQLTVVSSSPAGWQLSNPDGAAEIYDTNGNMLYQTSSRGQTIKFSYSNGSNGILYSSTLGPSGYLAPACSGVPGVTNPNLAGMLLCVTDNAGRQLNFAYDAKRRLIKMIDPAGGAYVYAYDNFANNNLASVTYPDNHQRTYLYNEAAQINSGSTCANAPTGLPNTLTGIQDENGVRFATYKYDCQGRAISSEHAGAVERHQMVYNTDASGKPTSTVVTDPLGSSYTYNFSIINGVVKNAGQSQPAGSGCGPASSGIGYDANGNVSSRTDFDGYKTTYTYDTTRNLETQRVEGLNGDGSARPETRTISTQWHSYWRAPVKVAEPLKLTTYVYNGDGGVTCAPVGATVPSPTGTQPIGVLCSRTEQATTDTNGSAGLTPTVTGTPRTWTFTYDQNGQVLTTNGPRTDVTDTTTYTYYATNDADVGKRGNLATVTDALSHVTQITSYDLNGRPLTIIDPNSVTLTFSYLPRGWLHTSSVGGQTTTYDYDNVGQLIAVTRPDGSKTSYGYDAAHRLTSVSDLAGNSVEFTLDNLGNVTSTNWVNPDNSTAKSQSATFDALGRLQNAIETRNAVNYTTLFGYDANGNPTTVTDPKTKVTTTAYDALNRPTQVTDALSGLTTLAYDARGQLTQFKAPGNIQTNFTVDGLGNVSNQTLGDWGNMTATYDAAGNLLTMSDARGIAETHTYDALNRPLTVSYPTTGETLTYTWDTGSGCTNGVGRLCQIADNGGSTSYAYDTRGNPVTKTRSEAGGSFTTSFTYDGADRVATIITPTNNILTAQRNTDGRVQQLSTSVASQNVNLVSAVQQNAAGAVVAQTYGNGVTQAKTFNTDGSASNQTETPPSGPGGGGGDADVPTLPEWAAIIMGMVLLGIGYRQQRLRMGSGLVGAALLAIVVAMSGFSAAPVWADETLTYDVNGNVQTRTLPGGTTTYGYDDVNRLNSEAGPAKTQSITYDLNDNRLSDGSGSKTYTANTDRLATINGVAVTLDAAGNITQANGLTYVWNQAAGQIKTVSQGAMLLATYYYDYEGHRSRKVTTASVPQGAGTVVYHYDLRDHLIAETTANGNPLVTYVWRDDIPVSIIVHGATETALYLETDHLGTPIAARNQAGTVVWKWESDAFGSTLPNEDPDGDGQKVTINLRFPGQYFDKESGLHNNHRRYYDPKLGRYMSPDPIGLAGGRNSYTYVGGNPLRRIDPLGLTDIVYSRADGRAYIYNSQGELQGNFPAANNIANGYRQFPNGTWDFDYYKAHPESGANGAYGENGIFIFNVPKFSGLGFHSGRANKGGYKYPTHGCVRSIDDATALVKRLVDSDDPLDTITVTPYSAAPLDFQ